MGIKHVDNHRIYSVCCAYSCPFGIVERRKKDMQVFATCNEINRLCKPLQSRFRRLHLPPYTKEQFLDIAVNVCSELKEEISRMIGEEVWKTSKDVRDVVSLSKLIRKSDGLMKLMA